MLLLILRVILLLVKERRESFLFSGENIKKMCNYFTAMAMQYYAAQPLLTDPSSRLRTTYLNYE